MTTALGQLGLWRPRKAAWLAALLCLMTGPTLRAQNSLNSPNGGRELAGSPRRVFVGTVTGRVTDTRTSNPLAGVAVEVEGQRIAAGTDDNGRYRLTGVPAGQRVIIARRLGYAAARQAVTVTDDQQSTADFAMQAHWAKRRPQHGK